MANATAKDNCNTTMEHTTIQQQQHTLKHIVETLRGTHPRGANTNIQNTENCHAFETQHLTLERTNHVKKKQRPHV